METKCECPDFWFEVLGVEGVCYFDECPYYDSCGGWTWDPPCGGCDSCIWAQLGYYDEDGSWSDLCKHMHAWSQLQAACA